MEIHLFTESMLKMYIPSLLVMQLSKQQSIFIFCLNTRCLFFILVSLCFFSPSNFQFLLILFKKNFYSDLFNFRYLFIHVTALFLNLLMTVHFEVIALHFNIFNHFIFMYPKTLMIYLYLIFLDLNLTLTKHEMQKDLL
jgi:hypothetical protein